MKKKELYQLSVKLSGAALREFFGAPSTSFTDMETGDRKKARQKVYALLAPLLLDKE
jgi:hypothetical protein